MFKVEDYREFYNKYFVEYNRLAVGEFADLSFGDDQPKDTCSSLESCIAYANYIVSRPNPPKWTMLNAGAGASSWMFRNMFPGKVFCSDPNERYLNFVMEVCTINSIDSDCALSGFDNFGIHERVDHVYYDYGMIERLPYLGRAIDLARYSVYVDDVDNREQCAPYREITIGLCKSLGLKWFDCMESKDEHGRHGIIIEK